MVLRQSDQNWYGDSHVDIRELVTNYSRANGYPVSRFLNVGCACGHDAFCLRVDDEEGYAAVECEECGREVELLDSSEYRENSAPESCGCPCGSEVFNVTCGESLYEGSDDSRWAYVGARCVACALIGIYADWKTP